MKKFWNYVKLCLVMAGENTINSSMNRSHFSTSSANEYFKNYLHK